MTDRLPDELPKTWLWRLKKLCKPTKDFCKLVNTRPSTFYAIASGTNASIKKVSKIERTLRELEKGKE